jgi:hypothetical protein
MVLSAIVAFGVVAIIATIAVIDQTKRIHDPEAYAEKRCHASIQAARPSPQAFASCVRKERSKSTISSILPLFVAGIVVIVLGFSGMFVGREQLRRQEELTRKLKGGG